jgi:hypothetical protein
MKRIAILGAVLAASILAACSSSTDTTPYSEPNCKASPWANNVVPPCTVPVNFVVDDTANKAYKDAEMQWKGQFAWSAPTRISYMDGNWSGPYAPLYDDGPWDGYASGNTIKYGHEPHGAVAGDHIFGVTVFAYPPASGNEVYGYGLIDHTFGDGWIWKGSNGSFTIVSGATQPVTATGMTIDPWGTVDVELQLDTANLEPNTCSPTPCTPAAWDFTNGVKVKGSAWGWYEVALPSSGSVYTFTMSNFVGLGNQLYHYGLTKQNDQPAFVFVFYAADGSSKEYKVGGVPPTTGVTAATKYPTGSWTAATVTNQPSGDKNTIITIP